MPIEVKLKMQILFIDFSPTQYKNLKIDAKCIYLRLEYRANIVGCRGVTLGDAIAHKNNQKFIIIRQIIGPRKIDSFTSIESILALISFLF